MPLTVGLASAVSIGMMERTITQRDMIRDLFRRFAGDPVRIVKAYPESERRGAVERKSNTYDMSAEEYASRLFADGVQKRWIQE